jgi:RNA polymerase sigma-70 factor, ECF subfamily
MGTVQAGSFSIRNSGRAPRPFLKIRRGRAGSTTLSATRLLNSNKAIAPPDLGKEWAIVQQAIAGNADAQKDLFAPHTTRLYRAAFAVLRNKEDAEDALQDGLCKAFTSLHSFQGRSSFSTWLTRIVINAALMTCRRNSAHSEASLDEILDGKPGQLPHGMVDARPDAERVYAAIEIDALVEVHVRQLSPLLQTVFRLRAIEGLSTRESSFALGIPASVLKSRLFRARRKLAQGLQQSRSA